MADEIDWGEATNVREMTRPVQRERPIDLAVSKILGKPILTTDPRLISLVVKWKKAQASSPDSERMDNFLNNPDFLVELRKTFSQ